MKHDTRNATPFLGSSQHLVNCVMEYKGDDVRQKYERALVEMPAPHAAILGDRRDPGLNFLMYGVMHEDQTRKTIERKAHVATREALAESRNADDSGHVPIGFMITSAARIVHHIGRWIQPVGRSNPFTPLLEGQLAFGTLPTFVVIGGVMEVGIIHVFGRTQGSC